MTPLPDLSARVTEVHDRAMEAMEAAEQVQDAARPFENHPNPEFRTAMMWSGGQGPFDYEDTLLFDRDGKV